MPTSNARVARKRKMWPRWSCAAASCGIKVPCTCVQVSTGCLVTYVSEGSQRKPLMSMSWVPVRWRYATKAKARAAPTFRAWLASCGWAMWLGHVAVRTSLPGDTGRLARIFRSVGEVSNVWQVKSRHRGNENDVKRLDMGSQQLGEK